MAERPGRGQNVKNGKSHGAAGEDRRRRRRKKRRHGRLFKPIRYAVALVAILLGVGVFFKITNIQVEGNVIYSDEEILGAAGLREGKSLLLAALEAADGKICSALPRIEVAEVRIKAPDTLIIRVTESQAAAYLAYEDKYVEISSGCKVLAIVEQAGSLVVNGLQPEEPEAGSMLKTAEKDEARLACLAQLLKLLENKKLISDVTDIDVSNLTDITFKYRQKLTVRMSGYDKIEYKLEFLTEILDRIGEEAGGVVYFTSDKEGHYIPE